MGQDLPHHQNVVVGKTGKALADGWMDIEIQGLVPERRCCWQDRRPRRRPAKPQQGQTLGRKLSCCWQVGGAAAFDLGGAAADGFAQRFPGAPLSVASNSQGVAPATSARSQSTPADTRDRWQAGGRDHRFGVAAGRPRRSRQLDWAGTWRAGKLAYNSGSAVHPYKRCRITGRTLKPAVSVVATGGV